MHRISLTGLKGSNVFSIGLFTAITDPQALKDHLLSADQPFECAIVDASKILSTRHILTATYRAINDEQHGRNRTRNIHSEILLCLSPTNNISTSLKTFGISETTQNVLLISVAKEGGHLPDPPASPMLDREIPVTDENLASIADLPAIRKIYKLDPSADPKFVESVALGMMAIRGS